jgi:hypothetical protein
LHSQILREKVLPSLEPCESLCAIRPIPQIALPVLATEDEVRSQQKRFLALTDVGPDPALTRTSFPICGRSGSVSTDSHDEEEKGIDKAGL